MLKCGNLDFLLQRCKSWMLISIRKRFPQPNMDQSSNNCDPEVSLHGKKQRETKYVHPSSSLLHCDKIQGSSISSAGKANICPVFTISPYNHQNRKYSLLPPRQPQPILTNQDLCSILFI